MILLIFCVFLSFFAIVLSTTQKVLSTKDHQDLLISILPDLNFEYELRKSKEPSLDAKPFYIKRLKSLVNGAHVRFVRMDDSYDFNRFKLFKKSHIPGEMAMVGAEIAQLQSLDDNGNVLLVVASRCILGIAYLYSEGEVLGGRELSINVELEGLEVNVSSLETLRKRITFLREAEMRMLFPRTTGHSNPMSMPFPARVPRSKGIRPMTIAQKPNKAADWGIDKFQVDKIVLILHELIHSHVLPYASRYESPICAARVYESMFRINFRRKLPNVSLLSIHEIAEFGKKEVKVVLPNGIVFKKGSSIINFADGSYYVAEHNGYISGSFFPPKSEGHISPFNIAFVVYPKIRHPLQLED